MSSSLIDAVKTCCSSGVLECSIGGRPVISGDYFLAFFLVSSAYAVFVNLLAIIVGAWRFQYGLADRLQRNGIGIELNPEYVAMSEQRIHGDRGGLLDLMESIP